MTAKEPEVRLDIQFRHQLAAAIFATVDANFGYAVQHQHVVDRQLGVARTKQFAIATINQFIELITAFRFEEIVAGRHSHNSV